MGGLPVEAHQGRDWSLFFLFVFPVLLLDND